jgi:hypothetical protein
LSPLSNDRFLDGKKQRYSLYRGAVSGTFIPHIFKELSPFTVSAVFDEGSAANEAELVSFYHFCAYI